MNSNTMAAIGALSLATLLSCGCGKGKIPGRPELFKVSGNITFEKEPVEGAAVVFFPKDHSHAAVGLTDANGNFQLQTYEPDDGAAPGAYRITVKKSYFDDRETEHHLLPQSYATADKSRLNADVDFSHENYFQFDLTK